jgi:CDP-diacylglycerol---glycerol-3-phosphate 3-phosphatidyltransferase
MKTWDEYASDWQELHGGYDPRTGSPFVRGWLLFAYTVGRVVARLGATPTTVTVAGVVLSAGVPALARPVPLLAAALVLLSAVADGLDGAVAVLAGRVSRLGGVYDALADRASEACWLIALWLLGAPAWLVLAGGGVSWLHEYLRARATAAGMAEVGVVTVAERPTRVILTVIGLVAGLAGGTAVTVVAGVWALLAVVGFGQLLRAVRCALSSSI